MDDETQGRISSFSTGARETKFPSLQVGAGRYGFQPHSVLDPILKSGNGLSLPDRQRLLINGDLLPSANGRSAATAEKRAWLDSPYKQF